MRGHDIVVIGTSAGGVGALQEIFRGLPRNFPASVFVVMHLTPHIPSFLPEVLVRAGGMPVQAVTGPTRFKPGHVYVGSPDHHLILTRTLATVNRGPRENWSRPAVDVLFRSAAEAHGPRVIGVVLTGFLDDGTAGLAAIKREGGIAIVQDPADALFPDMPSNAIQSVKIDHVVPLSEMAPTLLNLVEKPAGHRPKSGVSEEVAIETEIAKATVAGINGRNVLNRVGRPSTFTCPECQGPLWELRDGNLIRFRCQVGHAYSGESMLTAQQDTVERALWVALGAIESRVALWRKIAARMKSPHLAKLAQFYHAREADAQRDIEALRSILTRNGDRVRGSRTKARRGGSPPRASAASGGSAARRRPSRRARRWRTSLQT